jgi:hypothetical protein
LPQGIDLEAGGRNKKVRRTAPKSENVYLKLLVKVTAAASKQTSSSTAFGRAAGSVQACSADRTAHHLGYYSREQ